MDLYSWFNWSRNLTFTAGIITAIAAIATCIGMAGERFFGNRIEKLEKTKNEQTASLLRQQLNDSSKRIESLKNVIPDRIITPLESEKIIDYLKQHTQTASLMISTRNNERETVVFADQIYKLFNEANWAVEGPIISLVPGKFKGIGILIKNPENKPRDLFIIEHVLLEILKLEVEGSIKNEFQDNRIEIVIGAQKP